MELNGTSAITQKVRDLLIPLFLETPCRYLKGFMSHDENSCHRKKIPVLSLNIL